MSNFCPEWVFAACCAQTAHDFLGSNNSINMISKKFANELSVQYNEIKLEEISDVAEKILQFLSEIKAGEEAINFLNNFIHYRVCFNINGSERKLKGLFSSAFDGEKEKDYNSEKTVKVFRATIYSLRNGVINKAPPGWTISDVDDIDWLSDLFEQDVSLFNI
jgi:hypothetical protein